MQSLSAALKYLTVWGRITADQPAPETIGAGAVFFPIVGLLLGIALALLNYSFALYIDGDILSVLLIAVWLIATGGIHLDGTRQTVDLVSTNHSLRLGHPNDICGLIAVVLIILVKVNTAGAMDEKLTSALLLTPVFARWALVIFLHGYHDRCEEIPRAIAANVKTWHLVITTLGTLSLSVYFLGRKGLWIGLSQSLLALLMRTLIHRRQAVLTHNNCGAVIELGEALSLLLLASL